MRMLPRKKWTEAHKVLLDKDRVTATIQSATKNIHRTLPTQQDFTRVAEEFWFEVYHVAKYLKREELWLAKSRDWAAKILLLRIIEWNEQIRDNSNSQIYEDGKHMKSWISPDTWAELHKSFAHFDLVDSWESLTGMTKLFRDLAIETAVKLGSVYPENIGRNISDLIDKWSKD
jgi:aminoglycoside 6-adenylyltransferase